MSRWFKHYAGMTHDDKLRRVAVHTKQPLPLVVWVFCAILESAAELNNEGAYDFDARAAADLLHCEETDITAIVDTLTSLSRLGHGHVTHWRDRQHRGDTSAERQRRHRARKKAEKLNDNNGDGDVTVTSPSRDSNAKKQSTEVEADSERKKEQMPPAAAAPLEFSKEGSPEDQFWELATALSKFGIRRSLCVKLAKLNDGEFDVTVAQLQDAAAKRQPATYLTKIVRNLEAERERERERQYEQARLNFTIGGDAKEPEFVLEFRRAGYLIETRANGTWRIGGDVFDARGQVIGG